MNYSSNVVDIVALIYETIAYDDTWLDALEKMGIMLNAPSAKLVITDRKTQQFSVMSSFLSKIELERYLEQFAANDEKRLAIEELTIGAIKTGSELLDESTFLQSNLYEAFYKPHHLFHSLSTCFYRDAHYIASIEFAKPQESENFSNNDKKLLGIFIPHLTRAFGISLQIKLSQLQSQIQNQIKQTTDTALFLILEKNIARPMNSKAEKLIEEARILNLLNDKLAFKHSATNKRFQELVKQCLLTVQGKDVFPGGFIRLEAFEVEQDEGEWHIGVTPYRSAADERELWKAKGALVIIRSVEHESFERLNNVLADFYGLTASETQVLSKMISGLSSSEIADELKLTKECVRSRLKKIYQKTGVSNQVQLTHDILEGPYKIANMLGQTKP